MEVVVGEGEACGRGDWEEVCYHEDDLWVETAEEG